MKTILVALSLAFITASAYGQDALERDPGFVDIETIDAWFGTEALVEVNVKGALLNMVAEASRREDPELAVLLRKLRAINVRTFELTNANRPGIERRMADLGRQMQGRGWEAVAKVREGNDRTSVYMRSQGDIVSGLFVMVMNPADQEAVFVNIVGDIDPAQIGRIGARFDINGLER